MKAVNSHFDYVYKLIYEAEVELRSMINVCPLLRSIFVSFVEQSIDEQFSETLVRILLGVRPKLVLEYGSVTSNVLAAYFLKQMDVGNIISLESIGKLASPTYST